MENPYKIVVDGHGQSKVQAHPAVVPWMGQKTSVAELTAALANTLFLPDGAKITAVGRSVAAGFPALSFTILSKQELGPLVTFTLPTGKESVLMHAVSVDVTPRSKDFETSFVFAVAI